MAIYHLSAKVVSRGKGQSAIAAAAYRSGERLQDEQTGEQKFYEQRAKRILFTDIMAPQQAPEWAHERNRLWNEAERAEKRKDAQLAREIEVSLPHELTDEQRVWLIKDFAREAFVRRGYAVDIAIHQPDRGGDLRNHHAHLLITMRVIGPDGFSPTKDRSLNSPEQLTAWREQWAKLANRHLARHGHDARVDHRSLEAQGFDREATTHVGYAGSEIAARGGQSDRRDALDAITARNDLRAELRTTDAELAQLHELVTNENRKLRPAPETRRGTRAMGEGPSDDELARQPEREKAYLAHLQQRHERAQTMLAEQQRMRDLDDRAKAYQLAKEQEAEEGRKKQAAQESDASDGRNGDISSASARYSIAVGTHYDVRDPYASLARAAGAESAAFHKQQEQLKAEAAKEADPDKRQAIDLRRKIEGCEYMAITSDRLAGISVAVTGRDNNATAVTDRQQAAHWRAAAQGLREERSAVLETVQAREAAARDGTVARADKALESHQARRAAQEVEQPDPPPPAQVDRDAFADLRARRVVQPSPGPETAIPEQPHKPRSVAALFRELGHDDQSNSLGQPHKQEQQSAARPAAATGLPAPHRPDYRRKLPGRAAAALPAARLGSSWQAAVQPPSASAGPPAEPVRTPTAQQDQAPQPAAMPAPTRPAYRETLSPARAEAQVAEPRVIDRDGKDVGTLSSFVRREQPQAAEPYRPPPMGTLVKDPEARQRHQNAQLQEMERAHQAEQAIGRIGADLDKGRTVKADDLRSLSREQWDRVQTKGEDGLTQSVKEAKDRGAQDAGRGRGDDPPRRDW